MKLIRVIPSPATEAGRNLTYGYAFLLCLGLLATGCGTAPLRQGPASPTAKIPDPGPTVRDEPLSRYGNPEFYEVFGRRYRPLKNAAGFAERGIASWYGRDFHLRRTSSGETYDMYKMTAAHRVLPLPTYVEVTNLQNGRRAIVRVNDRGPFKDDRVIDLSFAAAVKLGVHGPGTARVELRTIAPGRRPAVRAATPSPLHRSPKRFGYYLQVGAFSDMSNAERLRNHIVALLDNSVEIRPDVIKDKSYYLVHVGPLATTAAASRLAARLTRIGVQHHRLIDN
ncbi:MAG: RlpA-like protein [Chromatiales bacterium USCg_Taylor]|nr:MAG: RlpA-like protein [Chromatiales bacterium USCg_Taylor]